LLTKSYFFQILFDDHLNHLQIILVFFNNEVKSHHKLHNHFSKEKAELEADLEAEALPEVPIFFFEAEALKILALPHH
jgi:hypothetical protein